MADIFIVQPGYGAARVDFDFAAASAAIDELDAMVARLDAEVENRVGPYNDVIVNWEGPHRDEFDAAWGSLQDRFNAGVTAASESKARIHAAIDEANADQRRYNRIAEEARAREIAEGNQVAV